MKIVKYILFGWILTSSILLSITQETASFQDFLYGQTEDCEYDQWVSHISEGLADPDYNLYAPWEIQTNGFGNFMIANEDTLEIWYFIVETFLQGYYDAAQVLIDEAEFPYTVVEFFDTDTDRTYYLLRENLNLEYIDDNGTQLPYDDEIGSFDFGWGLFVFNPAAANPIVVNVVHPNDDFIAPAVAYECFKDWDAMFLTINGAGREVKWTEQGNYSNSKSLSDPSRIEEHAFNVFYQQACDKIRSDFSRQEFSMQLHSYDWNRHDNHPDCQISAGNGRGNPNLPIRDLSLLHEDFINCSQYLMLPANTIGQHSAVYLNDYYSVNYNTYEFRFYNESGRSYPVSNNIDLPGFSANKQMLYSTDDWNHYDIFEPFYHLEMDELPNCYEETELNYMMFYGYNPALQYFEFDERYLNTIEYYSLWVDAMTETLPFTISLDDNQIPTTPQNFETIDVTHNRILLDWEAISCFDFRTYEILYATEPITATNYQSITREDYPILASPRTENYLLQNLNMNQEYFFQIRAIDYNGNISPVSAEISTYTAPAIISDEIAVGLNCEVLIHWYCTLQTGNLGFNVYERVNDEMVLLDGWETNPALVGTNQPGVYELIDDNVQNTHYYAYSITCENIGGTEYSVSDLLFCNVSPIYDLLVSNADNSIVDTVSFGQNDYATNYQDDFYDLEKAEIPFNNYVYAAFFEENWEPDEIYLQREINGYFNERYTYRTWEISVSTDQLEELITISLNQDSYPITSKVYLLDYETGQIVNLKESDLYFIADNTDFKTFRLIWGDFGPYASISNGQNFIYQSGSEVEFNWQLGNTALIEYQKLYLYNETDTLEIANSISTSATSYTWTVPEDVTFHFARLGLDIINLEGEIFSFSSNYKLGVVPRELVLANDPGWNMISSPWIPDANLPAATVFGPQSELYTLIDHNQYEETEIFEFGKGYWVFSPAGYDFTGSYPIVNSSLLLPLQPEWNLMTNPYPVGFAVKDLRFKNGPYTVSYSSLIYNGIIPKAVYVYRDGRYVLANEVNAFEAFLIYANISHSDNYRIYYYPYYSTYNIIPQQIDWQASVSISQLDEDELIFGTSSQASEEFDFLYDLPEPPAKPMSDKISLYFEKDPANEPTFIYRQLNREFKETISADTTQFINWDFDLSIEQTEALTVEIDLTELPEFHSASIYLDGNSWCNLVNNVYVYSFSPTQAGILPGSIIVSNNLTNTENIEAVLYEFTNFPNPFNPNTFIRFNLPEAINTTLSIYNMKGQKVCTLADDELEKGNYQYIWDGTNSQKKAVASGIYFIRLQKGNKIDVRRALLLK